MRDKLKFRLKKLLDIHGISGQETLVRQYVKKEIKNKVDNVIIDDYGNLLATKVFGEAKGNPVIMLNAHMDTVKATNRDKIVVEQNGVFRAYYHGKTTVLGADDRAGIAIVLSILDNVPSSFEGTLKLSFTREEEIGCIGASRIDKKFYNDVDLNITFDRRGNKDIVVGTWGAPFCSNVVGHTLENIAKRNNFDYRCVSGGVSDAYEFSYKGINSVNLSVGYENEHTSNEFLVYKDLNVAYEFGLAILGDIGLYDYEGFGEVPLRSNQWVEDYDYKSYGKSKTKANWDKFYESEYEGHGYNEGDYGYTGSYGYELEYTPFVYEQNGKIIISNNFDEVEIMAEHVDSLITQLKTMRDLSTYKKAIDLEDEKEYYKQEKEMM